MSSDFQHTVLLGSFFLVLFGFAEFLYHKLELKAEVTRKIVHFGTGILTLLFPLWIKNHWFILALCSSFLLLLLMSLRFNLLKSINKVNRTTYGSILYPIIVYGCFMVYVHYGSLIYFYPPILILAISDPIAALVGKKIPLGRYTTFGHNKTISGSAGFFLSAMIISVICMGGLLAISFIDIVLISALVALFSAIVEGFSHKGIDNFTIPISVLMVLILTLN